MEEWIQVVGLTSNCGRTLTILNTQTGDTIEIGWDPNWKVLALDETCVYWIGQDGRLKITYRIGK
jgi:hypothetical protein